MNLTPTRFDIWCISKLAAYLGRCSLFDMSVQSCIRHHVLGGIWFAACLFVYWMQGIRPGGQKVRQRVLTILLGSGLAITLAFLSEGLVSWPPPACNSALAHFYPSYLAENINDKSFPSESTALYASVAAGIFSLNRVVGSGVWIAVVVLVSLPRMYVGGHYPSDVFAGLILGLLGYFAARSFLEPTLGPHLGRLFEHTSWPRVLGECAVFLWILQIAVEFDEVVWIKHFVQYISK